MRRGSTLLLPAMVGVVFCVELKLFILALGVDGPGATDDPRHRRAA